MNLRHHIASACLFVLLALTACGGEENAHLTQRIRLATTTSTDNSGLLRDLLPRFTKATGIEVDVIPVGTGKALALGMAGDADVVLVHARSREDAFVAEGHARERRDVMWNDFVLLGPKNDPAGVRGQKDVATALKAIHAADQGFISRGDDSGTHIRERSLWEDAGIEPRERAPRYFEAGAGMGACLTRADELGAYVLCDRGTWLAYKRKLDLEILVEGDRRLMNPYGVMAVSAERHPGVSAPAAATFVTWLTGPEAQAAIGAFRVGGEPLFHPHKPGPEREGE